MGKIKTMLPFLIAITISYYFLPPLIESDEASILIFLVAIPLICFLLSVVYGIDYSINCFFSAFVTVLFILPMLIIYPGYPMWILGIGYGIVALIGNAVGTIFFKRNVRIKNLEKYGRYLVIVVIGSYITAIIASAIMMSQMTQISYHSTGTFGVGEELTVDFENNITWKNVYNVISLEFWGEIEERREYPFSNATKIKIKAVCTFSLFPLWQKSYENPWVSDGHQEKIVRIYKNRNSVTYISNSYPLTYWLVDWVIYDTIK